MILRLSGNCRTNEVSTVIDNFMLAYKKKSWENDSYMVEIFTELDEKGKNLRTAINRSKAESNLDKKDLIRDEKVKALNYLLLGSLHHPEETVKTAGEKLNTVFKKYGLKMTKKSYAIESSLIESLLQDFTASDLQADITAISGCTEIISEIKTAQEDFKSANFIWEEEKAKQSSNKNATQIKKIAHSIINDKIIVYLQGASLSNKEVYGELSDTIKQIVEDANGAVKRRIKKEEEPH